MLPDIKFIRMKKDIDQKTLCQKCLTTGPHLYRDDDKLLWFHKIANHKMKKLRQSIISWVEL